MPDQHRRLFFDIETAPLEVYVWALNSKSNNYISHKMLKQDYRIICICWKWEGKREVESLSWDRGQDDQKMLREFIPVLDSATEVVMQNGERFDIPKVRARAIFHRIPMRASYPTLDTLKKSRQKFGFPSHRLDYLGNHLVGEEKLPVEFELWRAIVEDKCPKAMAKMVKYCKQDVRLLEKVFKRLAPYIEPATSIASHSADCPWCGSTKTIRNGSRKRATGVVHVALICKDCGRQHGMPETKYLANKPLRVG